MKLFLQVIKILKGKIEEIDSELESATVNFDKLNGRPIDDISNILFKDLERVKNVQFSYTYFVFPESYIM